MTTCSHQTIVETKVGTFCGDCGERRAAAEEPKIYKKSKQHHPSIGIAKIWER
jgi:hypothetical protein